MTKQAMYLLGVKVPAPIKNALIQREQATGLSMSQQTREALMIYLSIKELRKVTDTPETGIDIATTKNAVIVD
jgi:hypothetical protein